MTVLRARATTASDRAGHAVLGLVAIAVLGAACTMPPIATPTTRPTPTPTPSPSPTPVPTPVPPTPTIDPTPNPAAIPDFAAGEIVASLIDGLRVRQRPGIGSVLATGLLPLDAEMEVIMGPFPVDRFGWYLVADADADEPEFTEGWVAAGYEPDPFLRTTGTTADEAPYLLSMAASGNAEEGPIEIDEDDDHAIRWIARDPEGSGCSFAVSLVSAGAEPVPTIRATVGSGIDRGTLQPQTFAALDVSGAAFVSVTSDCAWALVILRVPAASPEPSASATP